MGKTLIEKITTASSTLDDSDFLYAMNASEDKRIAYSNLKQQIANAVGDGIGDVDGGNYTSFESDGTVVFNGDATVWEDVNIGPLSLGSGNTKPGTVQILGTGGAATGVYTLGFDVNEEVSGIIEVPHCYKEGSDFQFHVHWSGNSAPSGIDYVKWQLEYFIVGENAVIPAAQTITVESAYDTQYERITSSFALIDGTGVGMGSQFGFTLKRIAAAGDAYSGDAVAHTIGIHFEQDTVGSRGIISK